MVWAYILAGLVGGMIGGMGMGGGTLLIPILTVFLGVEQHLAQAINLLVFIPTGIIAVIIHAKNKLINYKVSICVAIPAIIFAVCTALLVGRIESHILKMVFAIFLICVGVFELYKAIIGVVKKQKPIIKTGKLCHIAKNCNNTKFYIKR